MKKIEECEQFHMIVQHVSCTCMSMGLNEEAGVGVLVNILISAFSVIES